MNGSTNASLARATETDADKNAVSENAVSENAVALTALSIVRSYLVALEFDLSSGLETYNRAIRATRDALYSADLPSDVKKAVDEITDAAADNYAKGLDLLNARYARKFVYIKRASLALLFIALTIAFFFTPWQFCALGSALIASYFLGFGGFFKFTAKLIAKAVAKAFGK